MCVCVRVQRYMVCARTTDRSLPFPSLASFPLLLPPPSLSSKSGTGPSGKSSTPTTRASTQPATSAPTRAPSRTFSATSASTTTHWTAGTVFGHRVGTMTSRSPTTTARRRATGWAAWVREYREARERGTGERQGREGMNRGEGERQGRDDTCKRECGREKGTGECGGERDEREMAERDERYTREGETL